MQSLLASPSPSYCLHTHTPSSLPSFSLTIILSITLSPHTTLLPTPPSSSSLATPSSPHSPPSPPSSLTTLSSPLTHLLPHHPLLSPHYPVPPHLTTHHPLLPHTTFPSSLSHTVDKHRVVLRAEQPDYINATFINVSYDSLSHPLDIVEIVQACM